MLSRSMLIRLPGFGAGPADEMIARLQPGTLRWLSASDALAAMLGRPVDGPDAGGLLDAVHPDDRVLAEDEFRQAAELGERHDFVLRLRAWAGAWRYMRFDAQARYDRQGGLHHLRCHLKDVTDRVHAEQELRRRTAQLTAANEQLREANRKLAQAQGQLVHSEKLAALGTLAAGMAHEINNPLAYATNNVAVLGREVASLLDVVAAYSEGLDALRSAQPDLAERLARVEAEADLAYLRRALPELVESTRRGLARVAKIVQDLRDFSQVDRAEVVEVDLSRSLEQGLGLLAGLFDRQGIAVERRLAALPPLEASAAHLNQALFNLLLNAAQAIEATGRGSGTIRVATRQEGGEAVAEVADDGCGIPAEALPRIFDPFFTTKPAGSGTGLGLSLAHGIVSDHGGTIEVDSAVGSGTTFRVRLPLRPGGSGRARPRGRSGNPSS
jgi:signal transduction histidine kinase